MEAEADSPTRVERVVFETDRHRIVGDVTLPPDGYQSRFSDAVNRPDVSFIPLLDVEISAHRGGVPERRPFALLSKAHVGLAYPLEDRQ